MEFFQKHKLNKNAVIEISICFIIVAGLIIAAIIAQGYRNGTFGKYDFQKLASLYVDEEYCTIADDGSWVAFDTNPTDSEYGETSLAKYAISHMNEKTGFSDSLDYKMEHTTALDGLQKEENKKAIVEWKYHPDNGLEVIYTAK